MSEKFGPRGNQPAVTPPNGPDAFTKPSNQPNLRRLSSQASRHLHRVSP